MQISVNQILTDALSELNVIDAGNTPDAGDALFALGKFNQILDNWNAERGMVYADTFPQYTITPSLNPHTIGPSSATWAASERPVSIEGANVVLNSTAPYPYIPIRKRDAQWWQLQPAPTVTSTIPTDFYYDPTMINGSIYFFPVPTTAYLVQLWIRVLLAQVTQFQTIDIPQGYRNALMLTLAEDLSGPFRKTWTPLQQNKAQMARARIFSNNVVVPVLVTSDAGMPRGGPNGGIPNFFWPNGSLTPR